MFQLFYALGLVPRRSVVCARPDRGMEQPKPKPRRASPKPPEPKPETGIRWGDRHGVDGTMTVIDNGAEWTTVKPTVEAIGPDLWTLYDEQEFTREQTGRTRSFTRSEYLTLRGKYIKDPKMTNAQAGELYGRKSSWGKNRMQAVRRAVKKLNADIKANRPFPLPHRDPEAGVV